MEDHVKRIMETLNTEKVSFLQMQFTDILGFVKTLTVPKNRFENAVTEGVVFDGSSVAGYAQIEESDMRAVPDISTFTILPEDNDRFRVARFICDIHAPDGDQFPGDPRYILKTLLQKLNREKKDFFVGPEFEFFLFNMTSMATRQMNPWISAVILTTRLLTERA